MSRLGQPFVIFLIAVCVLLFGAWASGQVLYGVDGFGAQVWEFPTAPGAPCPQPNPVIIPCPYANPAPCILNPVPPPGPFVGPPDDIHGDIAIDSQRNTFFVTDGFVIQEYDARGPCGVPPPCNPLNAFYPPAFMTPINGLGMDELGTLSGGQRTLWLCDGFNIVGVVPSLPGSCLAPLVVFGPCSVPTVGQLTDLTWDPVSRSLWLCDTAGIVYNVIPTPPAGCQLVSQFPVTNCGLQPPLMGIAYDLGTPSLVSGGPPSLFVTDGFQVEAIDIFGAPAPPTFCVPQMCSPTPAPLSGLAYAANAISFGFPAVTATLSSAGQSSSPGPSFALELSGSPPATPWLLLSFNVPGPGYFCPPLTGIGTLFWVDPTGILVTLPVLPPTCVPINLPTPGAVATGLVGFMQVIYLSGGPPAADATNGLAFTFGPP